MAYFVVFGFAFILLSYALMPADVELPFSEIQLLQYAMFLVVSIVIIVLLKKRKNSVKYALAAQSIIVTAFSVITNITEFNDTAKAIELLPVLYVTLDIIISIAVAWLSVKIYIQYIDNFDRPKNTLIN